MGIGWHFLYEGLAKLLNPNWSSAGYLLDSEGFLKGFFFNLAGNPDVLKTVDFLNVWGLILIGLALILGVFHRFTVISGIILLAFYYFSHPSWVGLRYAVPSEGTYLVVNKTLIEMLAMFVLFAFPTSREFGLDRFISGKREKP
jgi:thiosulfate dehydrogenase [quinone] large subunit